MVAHTTVSVWGLPVTATEDDVRRLFEAQVHKKCEPIISHLVLDPRTDTKATTVTFKCSSESAVHAALARLKKNNILDISRPHSKETIGIGQSFRYLTTLACRSEHPAFEYVDAPFYGVHSAYAFSVVFVHGLNGHAFNTFATRPRKHREVRMWARDILPDLLDRAAYSGRYMSYGYPARLLDWETIPHNLKQTALGLLDQILQDRPHDCHRPLFFVCHSLGGLVVCQVFIPSSLVQLFMLMIKAIVLALQNDGSSPQYPQYRQLLMPLGEFLVKGIAFFSTPFTGSVIANWEPVARIVPFGLNMSYVRYLKQRHKKETVQVDPEDVNPMVDQFRSLVKEYNIPLLIYFEEKRTWGLPVVSPESAAAQFGDEFPPIGIFGTHEKMVKFESAKDIEFSRKVAPRFKKMVEDALITPTMELPKSSLNALESVIGNAASGLALPAGKVDQLPHAAPDNWAGAKSDQQPSPNPTPWFLGRTITSEDQSVLDLLKFEIFQGTNSNRGNRIDPPLEGTCDWIQDRKAFVNWRDSTRNAVIFIIGGPGQGKSVLAKFSVTSLLKYYPKKPIVVSYFVEKTRSGNTPDIILKRILAQLWGADKACFERCVITLSKQMSTRQGVEFWWALLSTFRLQMGTSLLCIIDGLDECIVDSKARGQTTVDDKMVGFLRRVCQITKETDGATDGITTRILITSRPKPEVLTATSGKDVTYEIEPEDIKAGVAAMIKANVKSIAEERGLSGHLQAFITEKLIAKSGPQFQLARSLIDLLRDRGYDLGSASKIEQTLANFNADDLQRPYFEALETMRVAYRGKAASLIRIVCFAFWELDMEELQHALAMPVDGERRDNFNEFIDEGLEFFIKNNCSILLTVDKKTRRAYFGHPTISEFFQDLPERDNKWSIFSCKNQAQGHLELALICVHYLLSWLNQPVSQEQLDADDGEHLSALMTKSVFLAYAINCWPHHVRKAGDLILPFVPLVSKLLRPDTPEYQLMLQIQSENDESADYWDFKFESPPHLLASYDLVHVLRALRLKTKRAGNLKPRRWNGFSLSRLAKKPVPSADVLEFGVDDRDYYQSTPLHDAAQNGAKDAVEFLLEHGADGSLLDKAGQTPFYLAVEEGHAEIAHNLIKHNQYHPGESSHKFTPLHWACGKGMDDIVEFLLSKQADPDAGTARNWTPVHVAANAGQSGILRRLLEAGGDSAARTTGPNGGRTPLHLAVIKGSSDSVAVLVEFKPDLDFLQADDAGYTPLYYSAQCGHIELFHWLRSRAPLVKPAKGDYLPIHIAARNGHLAIVESLLDRDNVLATDKNGFLPLHYAAGGGHLSVVKKLVEMGLKYGFDIDTAARDLALRREVEPNYCVTPLFSAVYGGSLDVCKYLLEKGANKDIRSSRNQTLIHHAGRAGHVDIFDFLVQKGLDPCAKDVEGQTAFHFAASVGAVEVVNRYIQMANENRIDIDVSDGFGYTPLLEAINGRKPGHIDIVEKLLQRGADPNHIDVGGWSPVLIAARYEDTSLLKKLLDFGAKPHFLANHGDSALHKAAAIGNHEAVRLLIAAGADIDVKDKLGRTPLMHAVVRFDAKLARVFLGANADPCVRDALGYTPLDYGKKDPKLWALLASYSHEYQPAPPQERYSLANQCIARYLSDLPDHVDFDDIACRTSLWTNLLILGKCFNGIGKADDTKVCLEYYGTRTPFDRFLPSLACEGCRRTEFDPGEFYICRDCFDTFLCYDCFKKLQRRRIRAPCDKKHEFTILGGEDYVHYPPGAVNRAGQTMDEWIAEKKKEYGVAGSSTDANQPPESNQTQSESANGSITEPGASSSPPATA